MVGKRSSEILMVTTGHPHLEMERKLKTGRRLTQSQADGKVDLKSLSAARLSLQQSAHLWMFVHCSGKEMSMYNDNFRMILSLAANCFEHLLSFLVAVNLFPLLLPCKVGAVLSGLSDPQHCFGGL